MTANIQQSVAIRRRPLIQSTATLTADGNWQAKITRHSAPTTWSGARLRRQRGSITQSTLTLALSLVSLAVVMMLSFFYLQQVFSTSAHGSDIQKLETQLLELREQHREAELRGAELRSIQAVEDRVDDLQLEHVGPVSYLLPQSEHLAAAH